jgi:DNA-binding transcriptional regulator YiaG
MREDKKQTSYFEDLRAGLEAGIQYARGELNLHTRTIPATPRIDADELIRLRKMLKLTQIQLARTLSVSVKTLRSWERGVQAPPHEKSLQLLDIKRSSEANQRGS